MSVPASRVEYHKEWYQRNRERRLSRSREWYQENKEEVLARTNARGTAHYHANKEAALAKNKAYREANKKRIAERTQQLRSSPEWIAAHAAYVKANREKLAAIRAAWRKSHPAEQAAAWRRRQARKMQATPEWADDSAILRIYQLAADRTKETGIQHSVDHIVPLKHRLVCGLHCEDNLQVLTKSENSSKSNRFTVE